MFDRGVLLEEVDFGENLTASRARENLVAELEKQRIIGRDLLREPVFDTGFRVGFRLHESDERVLRRSGGSKSR